MGITHSLVHRQGFGKRLMFGCEAFAAELGLRKMSASVDSSQRRLLHFYLGMGGVIQTNSAPPRP